MMHPFRGKTAIAGVGRTPISKQSGVTTLTLALQAITAALADAGLEPADVDGVACFRVGDSVEAKYVAQCLGIRDLRYHLDQNGGGGVGNQVLASAAMAVATSMATCVVCWRALNARSGVRMGGSGRAPAPNLESPYYSPYGIVSAPQKLALYARAFMHDRGVTEKDLGAVAIAQREYAQRNERATQRSPLTMDDYLASRWIAEPLRLYDCCLESDGAVALVITSAERARHLAQSPVLIAGAAYGSGHLVISNGWSDLATSSAAEMAPRLYSAAGIGPTELDVVELYDPCTALVLVQLEDYGLCGRGEAAGLVGGGGTRLGGPMPTNTHGGHLSEGYIHGMNHVAEAVDQLRGHAGDRQVTGAETALVTSEAGYVGGNNSAMILRRDER